MGKFSHQRIQREEVGRQGKKKWEADIRILFWASRYSQDSVALNTIWFAGIMDYTLINTRQDTSNICTWFAEFLIYCSCCREEASKICYCYCRPKKLLENASFIGFRNSLFLPVIHALSLRILVCERKHTGMEVCTL